MTDYTKLIERMRTEASQMSDIMKLADDYARLNAQTTAPGAYDARAALQSAIEALQEEVSALDVLLEECKMDWSGDVTQLKAEHKREIEALQAENERLKVERENDAFRLVWAMNWMRMSVHDHGFTKHVLERGGMGDYSDCATYVDKCAGATQEAAP